MNVSQLIRYCVVMLFTVFIVSSPIFALQNATRQDIGAKCNIRVNKGNIAWTNPNLNTNSGGTYNRIAITRQTTAGTSPAAEYVEVGWVKQANIGSFGNVIISEFIYIGYSDVNSNVACNCSGGIAKEEEMGYKVEYE